MKNFLFFLISLFVGVGLFAWAISFIGWKSVKEAFLVFSGWQGMVILGLTFLAALVGNLRWREILKEKNISVSFFELLRSYLAGFSIMFLAPIILFGGEVFRGYALKERNGVTWQKGASSVLVDRILELTTNVFVIFLGIIIFFLSNGFPSKKLAAIFLGVPLFLGVAIFIFYFKAFKKESLVEFLLKLLGLKSFGRQNGILDIEKETLDFFKLNKKLLSKVFFLSFLRSGLMYLRTLFLISFLGVKIGWLSAVSILGFTYLALLVPIPAALGLHELIQASAFNYFGVGLASAAAFTMVIRGAELVVAFLGVFFLFRLGISILKTLLFKKLGLGNNNGHQ
ncbi:MAG: lysylphosphatidylglycerol synthase transmembrane domain-containing protein [bacterium]|nr:lysylphosphatidylglycerol synthase transmembrane domain-containing protein [bacterium]